MKSIWQKNLCMPSFQKLQGDVKTDVLIIGGGIAGLLTAYFLKESGVDCILVEKRHICSGTTGYTTAKITFQHGLIYHKILKNNGLETAQKYIHANFLAFENMLHFVKRLTVTMSERITMCMLLMTGE